MLRPNLGRRDFLRGTALAATAPLLAGAPVSAATGGDPERLFREGRFADADRGFARLLAADPDDAQAMARRGYVALLSNRLPDAERFLTGAIGLNKADKFAKDLLVDCYLRQDRFADTVPLLTELGREPHAKAHAAMTGTAYEVSGPQETRIPWLALDPLPTFEASIRGGAPLRFTFDTGGSTLNLSQRAAEQAGLRAVSSFEGQLNGRTFTMYLGVLDSFRTGELELRNIPVQWQDAEIPHKEGGPPTDGVIGRTVFYHFLTTLDYANRALVLRRKNSAGVSQVRREASRPGVSRVPLYLAANHYHFAPGKLGDLRQKLMLIDTGAAGGMGVFTSPDVAKRAGVRVDFDRPDTSFGDDTLVTYPCFPHDSGFGAATAPTLYGLASDFWMRDQWVQFETGGNFGHAYLKPFTVTYDVVGMNLYFGR